MRILQHRLYVILSLVAVTLGACSFYDNQTTYFNTYYNMQRIMGEVEDEFAFQDENKRTKPRVLVPGLDSITGSGADGAVLKGNATMQFLKVFVVEKTKLQPVATKVDSILIKGSKVLTFHPKSNYVEGSLFLMAKSYFFRQEWVTSQQKCIEQIEKFPDGDLSPDGHLLLAKNYLLQRKVSQGKQTLSRTIDVAWYKGRYDILSEAFRIQAEMALEEGTPEKAEQPYRQAIAQSDDDVQNARWQVDLASISYRLGNYKVAAEQFEQVFQYTPDPLAQFEALLYKASSLTLLRRFDEAEQILVSIEANRNFDDWSSFVVAERLALERGRKGDSKDPVLLAREKQADTSFIGKPELMAQSFQKAMKLYQDKQYEEALKYFAKAKTVRTPVFEVANKYFTLIRQWEDSHRKLDGIRLIIPEKPNIVDTIKLLGSRERYTLGRIHEQMDNRDSALYYYELAHDSASVADPDRGKYLYAQARMFMQSDPARADSLMEQVTLRYPTTDVARQAFTTLGFTADVEIDDAAELYKSATSFRKVRDFTFAQRQYMTIVQKHGTSEYAPQALYALGWMYEHDAGSTDSALHYYMQLLETYPRSEYAKEVRASVEFALASRNGVQLADSLMFRDQDAELLERAKAGEMNALDQLIKNNQDALQVPNMNIPQIPGVPPIPGLNNGTPSGNSPDGRKLPPNSSITSPQMSKPQPLSIPVDSSSNPPKP